MLSLPCMKKRLVIVNVLMSAIIVFLILFQSVHSFEHYEKRLTEKCAHFSSGNSKAYLNHSHHTGLDKCSVCDFLFSPFASINPMIEQHKKDDVFCKKQIFYTHAPFQCFKGSLFSLRAPPLV